MTSVRSPIRSMRMTPARRVGAADEIVALEPVLVGEPPLLRRQERQHRLQRIEAEVLPLGDSHAARLGELEIVATSSPQTERPSIRSTVTRRS